MDLVTLRHDSPLGRWTHSQWRPPHLAGLVESIGLFEGTVAHRRERAFPDGLVELIVHLGERYRLVEGDRAELCATVCLGGVQTGPIVVEAPPSPCAVLSVRLRPAGAYALLGRSLAAVSGITVDLQDLLGKGASELAERCHQAPSTSERLWIAADWVAARAARSPGVDPAIAFAAAQIERRAGAVSIAALRERTGLTRTRLATAFREQIGVPPKLYARIQRFRRVLAMIHEGAAPLADIALAAGYYDQPHMNAEFRELSGLAPTGFLAADRYPGSVSVAEASS
jgi:AraC-like DNA-binding protein